MKRLFKNTYLRYLASFVVILILPLLVFGISIHWFFTSAFIEDVLEKNLNIPQRIQMAVDMQVDQLNNFSYQVGADTAFASGIPGYITIHYEAAKTLSSFNAINEFVYDVFYYTGPDDNIYYSDRGIYDPDILFQTIYRFENLSSEDFSAFSELSTKPKWIAATKAQPLFGLETSYVAYIRPVYGKESRHSRAFLVFLIKPDSFQRVIGSAGNTAESSNAINIIANQDDELIFISDQHYLQDTDLHELLHPASSEPSRVDGWETIHLQDTKVYVSKQQSETGLTYLTLMPENIMLEGVLHLQSLFAFVYIAVVTFGFILILFISRYHYRPVKKLQDYMQPAGPLSAEDVIGMAESTIRSLSASSLIYRQEAVLLDLLQEPPHEIHPERLSQAGLLLPGPYYQCAIIKVCTAQDQAFPAVSDPPFRKISFLLKDAFSKDCPCYAIKYIEHNCFILVLSHSANESSKYIPRFESGLAALQRNGIESTLYVGNAYSSLELLHQSYAEAKKSFINHRDTDGPILLFCEAADDKPSLQAYPDADLKALCKALLEDDIMMIEFLSNRILGFIRTDTKNYFMARCICYEAINCIFKTAEKKQAGWIHTISKDITANLPYSSLEDLLLIIKTLCSRVIVDIEHVPVRRRLGIPEALVYIDAHFCDPDFSVKALAMDYSMTISNFSHQFKTYTGKTVSDYINEKKLSYAKALLSNGCQTITEVAQMAGYLHPSSFIRKFKQIEGITPGEFQEKARLQAQDHAKPS